MKNENNEWKEFKITFKNGKHITAKSISWFECITLMIECGEVDTENIVKIEVIS